MNGHPMRIKLIRAGLLVYLANHYTNWGGRAGGGWIYNNVIFGEKKHRYIWIYFRRFFMERIYLNIFTAQSASAVEYTDCISAEG